MILQLNKKVSHPLKGKKKSDLLRQSILKTDEGESGPTPALVLLIFSKKCLKCLH